MLPAMVGYCNIYLQEKVRFYPEEYNTLIILVQFLWLRREFETVFTFHSTGLLVTEKIGSFVYCKIVELDSTDLRFIYNYFLYSRQLH